MIEKICSKITKKIQNKMSDVDSERAEVINYGLQLIIGEIPKTIIIIGIAWLLGVLKLTLITILVIMPYRIFSGGVHLKTHLGCIIVTTLFYTGTAIISKSLIIEPMYIKYILISVIWIFSIIMIKLYAPADTEEVPILRQKERKIKKILSYITMTLTLAIAVFIKDSTISNILIFGTLFQTIMITRFVYKLTNNKYGYEEYYKNKLIDNLD